VPNAKPLTILCVASYFKGNRFLERCKREGCTVYLLTIESLLQDPWARQYVDEVFAMPSFTDRQAVINVVTYLARTREFDRIAPLDDFDVELVAQLREHLRIPGMGDTTARYFRDKLAMRARAQDRGLPIPPFTHILHHGRVAEFMKDVSGPWVLKPRSEASSIGIKKIERSEDLWPLLEQLGDRQSYYLLEKMIPGDVFHVDGVIWDKQLVFAEAHKYRRPMLEVSTQGGIFATRTLPRDSTIAKDLVALTGRVVNEFGLVRGVTHTEIIQGRDDGKLYFLETAARVGGANIADLVEASTGVNLWEEWARIEVSQGDTPYKVPEPRKDYAGLIVSLARQEHPDTAQFDDAEVVWRLTEKKHHVGLIVRSTSSERIEQMIESYIPRIQRDYHAALPPTERATA
jgi:biotin carboxylase